MNEKSIIFLCPVCKKVAICGTFVPIDENVSRILAFNANKITYSWKLCDECSAIRPSSR